MICLFELCRAFLNFALEFALRLAQLFDHRIERGGELSEFVLLIDVDESRVIATTDRGCSCRELVKRTGDLTAQHKRTRHPHDKQKRADDQHSPHETVYGLQHHVIGELDQNQPRRAGDWTRQSDHRRVAVATVSLNVAVRPHLYWRL